MKNVIWMVWVLGAVLFTGCSKEEFQTGDAYIRIIDHPVAGSRFHPLALAATSNGTLVWGAMGDWTPVAIWLDAEGLPTHSWVAPSGMVAPVQGVIQAEGRTFSCVMDPVSLATIVLDLSTPGAATEEKRFSGIMYPLALATDRNNQILLLSFNRFDRRSVFTVFQPDWTQTVQRSFPNYQEIDELLLDHMQFKKRYPVMVGQTLDGSYFMNGFVNYSFSLALLNAENLQQTALYQGTQYKGGVSGFLSLGNGTAMVARFLNDDAFLSNAPLGSGLFVSQDLGGSAQYGWMPRTPVLLQWVTVDGQSFLLRGVTLKDGQVQIQMLDPAQNMVLGVRSFGGNQPVELASILLEPTGHLNLLVHTTLLGGLSRMGIIRLAPWEVKALCEVPEQ